MERKGPDIPASSGSLKRMETFPAHILPCRAIRGAWVYGMRLRVCRVPRARMVPLWVLPWSDTGSSALWIQYLLPLWGHPGGFERNSVLLHLYSVLTLLLPTLPSPQSSCWCYSQHPCITSVHLEAPHIKGPEATGPVVLTAPPSWCSSRKATSQVLSSHSAL